MTKYQNALQLLTDSITIQNTNGFLNSLRISLEFISYLCGIFLTIVFLQSYSQYNLPFYKVETDYIKWVTNLPAYSFCPEENPKHISDRITRFGVTNDSDILEFITGLVHPAKKYCRRCYSQKEKAFPQKNYRSLLELLSPQCEGIVTNCYWNRKPFQCCQIFQRLPTKRGDCYSLHSKLVSDPNLVPNEMAVTYQHHQAVLEFELESAAKIFIHDRKDLEFYKNADKKITTVHPGQKAEVQYRFSELIEDSTSWLLNMKQRNCVLAEEKTLASFNIYSQSACRLRCLVKKQLSLCDCKHHLFPGLEGEKDCDIVGLKCLDHYLKNGKRSNKRNRKCKCKEDCSNLDIHYIQYLVTNTSQKVSKINIRLASPPSERITMTSRFTFLDAVVTLACLSRLITNATFDEMILQILWRTWKFFKFFVNLWNYSPMRFKNKFTNCNIFKNK